MQDCVTTSTAKEREIDKSYYQKLYYKLHRHINNEHKKAKHILLRLSHIQLLMLVTGKVARLCFLCHAYDSQHFCQTKVILCMHFKMDLLPSTHKTYNTRVVPESRRLFK